MKVAWNEHRVQLGFVFPSMDISPQALTLQLKKVEPYDEWDKLMTSL